MLYDCDAESYGYEKGLVARTRFHCEEAGKAVRISVDPVEGSFENMPAARDYTFQVALDRKPSKVLVGGKVVKGWTWSGEKRDGTLSVDVPACPVAQSLSITVQR